MEPRGLLAVWSDRALPPTASGAVRVRRYVEAGPGAGGLLWQETADAPDRAGTEQRVGTAYRLAWSSGPAPAEDAPWLYLVQTDCADPAQEAGFYDWYDHKHLPALAGVPGVLRARRYDALAGSPASLAAFELTAREVFEGPAWLAARLTPCTDRMRRLYVNAQRRMYRLQPAIEAKGYRGARGNLLRSARSTVERALRYAYRDRRQRKRQFRSLWIARINSAARIHGLSYSRFMNGLVQAGIQLDRKVLADLAYRDPQGFAKIAEAARQNL